MNTILRMIPLAAGLAAFASIASAQPLRSCAPDAIVSGTVCMDRYEASVWRVPNPKTANASLVKAIRAGKATRDDLIEAGATQLGVTGDDYAPCADSGQNCTDDIYALSLLSVFPARDITWLQAQQACKNSRKRLPSNAEWQAAVTGTPDAGPDDGIDDCHTDGDSDPVETGSRHKCVSARGAYDMVGNLLEWVSDWLPRSKTCGAWGSVMSPTGDEQCLAGAATDGEPGVLLRGGGFLEEEDAGPLTVYGHNGPSESFYDTGFRCAR